MLTIVQWSRPSPHSWCNEDARASPRRADRRAAHRERAAGAARRARHARGRAAGARPRRLGRVGAAARGRGSGRGCDRCGRSQARVADPALGGVRRRRCSVRPRLRGPAAHRRAAGRGRPRARGRPPPGHDARAAHAQRHPGARRTTTTRPAATSTPNPVAVKVRGRGDPGAQADRQQDARAHASRRHRRAPLLHAGPERPRARGPRRAGRAPATPTPNPPVVVVRVPQLSTSAIAPVSSALPGSA